MLDILNASPENIVDEVKFILGNVSFQGIRQPAFSCAASKEIFCVQSNRYKRTSFLPPSVYVCVCVCVCVCYNTQRGTGAEHQQL